MDDKSACIIRAHQGSDEAFNQPAEAYQRPGYSLCCRIRSRETPWKSDVPGERKPSAIARKVRSALSAAALHGPLKNVRDLGMPLISVTPVESGEADLSDDK